MSNDKSGLTIQETYRSGWSLPQTCYTSDAWFERDLQMLQNQWMQVATVLDLPEPGDYHVVEIGHISIILVRDEDQQIRGFFNTCCHRGARICTESKGSCSRLVCPYHGWTYNFSGQLIFASLMSEGFDPTKFRLSPVHVEVIGGLIFICMADSAPDSINQVRSMLEPYLAPYKLSECKIAAQHDLIEQGNWKLVIENNRECYHCASNHPELLNSFHPASIESRPSNQDMQLHASLSEGEQAWHDIPEPILGEYTDSEQARLYEELLARKCAQWNALNLPWRLLDFPYDLWFRVERFPLLETAVSHTLDGKLGCNVLLPLFEKPESSGLSLWTHPNSWNHFLCDHIMTFCVLPVSKDRSLLRTTWIVNKDAREGVDYDVDNLTHVWMQTNEQDRMLVENNARGICSPRYLPGPYSSKSERYVTQFINWYAQRTGLAEAIKETA